jgi:hypothetical protein
MALLTALGNVIPHYPNSQRAKEIEHPPEHEEKHCEIIDHELPGVSIECGFSNTPRLDDEIHSLGPEKIYEKV